MGTSADADSVPVAAVDLPPAPRSTQSPASAGAEGDGAAGDVCVCGVLDFESDGPPTGLCALRREEEGVLELESTRASPSFRATLTPKDARRPGERAHYAYAGVFELACAEDWCGRRELDVLELEPLDLRVVVARSDDGPPSHVLWVTCPR